MSLFKIIEAQVLDRIRFENPWWVDGQIDDYYRSMKQRLYYKKFFPLIQGEGIKRAVVLMGPRRVGKTVMIFHAIDIDALNEHFTDYINYGGYPEVSLSKEIQADPGRLVKSDIIDKVLLRDLPVLYGIQDVQELNSLFTTIAFNSGNEFTYDQLSTSSGVSKNTIKKYVGYLEAAFLIRTVNRVDMSGKKFKRANYFKMYLTNPSLRSALFSPIAATSEVMGNMVETAIYAQWFHRHWYTPFYARWRGGEVDIVGLSKDKLKPAWAVEIKWSNHYAKHPEKLKSLTQFMAKNDLDRSIVTTIDVTAETQLDDLTLDFMPAALYCYTVGRRTLE